MSSADRGSLRAWLVARVALASLLLGSAFTMLAPGAELRPTGLVIEGILALTILSSFAVASYASRGGSERRAGAVLMLCDIGFVTAAVAVTGGAGSVLAALYGAVILGSATTVGGRIAYLAGGLSLGSYSAVGLGLAFGYLHPPNDQNARLYRLDTEDLLFSILSNAVAMIVVTLLSDWLAVELDRRTGALAASEASRELLHARYEDIVRSIGSGLLTVAPDGRVTSANPAARSLLRIDTIPDGLRIDRHFPALADGPSDSGGRLETRTIRSDGTEFVSGYAVAPLRGRGGEPIGRLLVFQDLTEIHRLELAERDAERLTMLGRVAATLAHEIRNPLSSISGSVELVREHASLDDEDRHLLALVGQEVERLDALVRDMLDVARPRAPRFTLVDAAAMCRDVAAIAKRGTTVDVVTDVTPELEVVADADMLRQLLWNLTKNAIQSSPAGGVVRIEAKATTNGGFAIVVLDEGPGIADADRKRIFEAFHTGRRRGVGLGLAIVRRIVEAHRGDVRASNRPEGGARFDIVIPHLARSSTDEFVAGSDGGSGEDRGLDQP